MAFAIAMAVTPGPNNVMLAASGANFGLRASWPHIWGITLGFPLMLIGVGLGLAPIFNAYPALHLMLKGVSVVYLCWLAYRIATSRSAVQTSTVTRPLSWPQAAAFQWVNPKAWVIAIGAVTSYTIGRGLSLIGQVIQLSLINAFVTILTCVAWTVLGAMIARHLRSERSRTIFNATMATLLLAAVAPTLFEIVLFARRV